MNNDIVIYQSEDGQTKIDVRFENETVWLTQQQMAELFQTSRTNVVEHIQHIYEEGELEQSSTCRNFRQVRQEGNRRVERDMVAYNLDMIISLGYHYAAHGHTAAEVIYKRADAQKPFMGLTSFAGEIPTKKDIGIAKNYLNEKELKILNNLVSGYFDFAEIQAIEHKPMYMSDYILQLDNILSSGNRKLLVDSGFVSHQEALEKAETEYRKYQQQTLSPVEKAYLETIKQLAEKSLDKK